MYVTNPESKKPIFQINQHIGDDKDVVDDSGNIVQRGDGMGIDGMVFANEVLSFNDNSNVDELLFFVNSQGGDVQRSLDMFNAIARSSKKTRASITGFAFSCAGWIPMAADVVEMVEETGRWMCHMPYNPENPEEKSQFMDEVVDIISKTISSKSGRNGQPKKTQEEIKKLMKEKTYWDAERMLKEGLIDKITNASGKVVKLEKDPITLNKEEIKFFYKELQTAQNSMLNRDFNTEEREKLSKEGKALPDGSFPIENEKDLKNAIQAFGRAKDKDKAKKHIEKRAKELGLENLIPDNWKKNKNSNNMAYEKIVNRLNKIDNKVLGFKINLAEDATEQDIMDTVVRLDNRLRVLNDDMMDKEKIVLDAKKDGEDIKNAMKEKEKEAADFKKKAEDSMCEYNKLKEAHDKMELENKEMKEKAEANNKEKAETALALKKEKATNLINENSIKIQPMSGKTIEETKEYLVNRAVENYEDVAYQFSMIPVKFSAPKPKREGAKNEGIGADGELNIVQKLVASNNERVKTERLYVKENGVLNEKNTHKVAVLS